MALALCAPVLWAVAAPAQDKPGAVSQNAAAPAKPAYEKKNTWFSLKDYSGKTVDLADYAGRPVLVIFFASWCPDCRKADPVIHHLKDAYGPKGLSVIAVSIENEPEKVRAHAEKYKFDFPALVGGKALSKSAAYKARGVPGFYLLDAGHSVAGHWFDDQKSYDKELSKAIEALLAKKS